MTGANHSVWSQPQLITLSRRRLIAHKPPASRLSQAASLPPVNKRPWPPRRLIATLPKLEFRLSHSQQKTSHFLIATKTGFCTQLPVCPPGCPNPLAPVKFSPHPAFVFQISCILAATRAISPQANAAPECILHDQVSTLSQRATHYSSLGTFPIPSKKRAAGEC
jgi:hypothetical protein